MGIQADVENSHLRAAFDEGVATLTIDRPARKNAITHAMWLEIAARVRTVVDDTATRAIVLRGAGVDFSAGADIGEFGSVRSDSASARAYEKANCDAFTAIREANVPVIAAIRGVCLGGGFGLAAACDLRIATPDARFAVPAARLGLAYPHDAMADIVNAVGPQMARYLTYCAARIDAPAALSAGFLLEVVDADRLDARVADLAARIAKNAPLSIRASKPAIRAVLSGKSADIASAKALGDATFDSSDYAEGRSAFAQKRQPAFKGR